MNEKTFVSERRGDWDRLAVLASRAELSVNALSGKEIREFARLYRAACRDLAFVRTRSTNATMERFLNDLVGRSHTTLYQHPRKPLLPGLLNALLDSCRAIRRRWAFVGVSIGLFSISAALTNGVLTRNSELIERLVPREMLANIEQWKTKKLQENDPEGSTVATSFYIVNNTMATVTAAAGGLTFGLMTVYGLYENGAILGALYSQMKTVHGEALLVTSLLPHGVTELGGIFISSAGGLLLGWALIAPGRRSRSRSIRAAAKDAMSLMILGIVMIWIAAPIEAWVSFSKTVPPAFKVAFGLFTLLAWTAAFLLGGREKLPRSA